MLKLSNFSFEINGKKILDNINIELADKCQLTILGPNGSGKSTLIKSICGINKSWTGELFIQGKNVKEQSQRDLSKVISYVPQFLEVHADFTVWDFFEMSYFPHLDNFRSLSLEERERGEEILESFHLIDLRNRSMMTLSGGERQKVFIASSVFQNPKILLLDEPTSYLDPKHQDEVNQLIFNLKSKMNIVLVSHDINSSLINSERVIGLKNGSIFFDGSPSEVLEKNHLNDLFDKKFNLIKHPNKNIDIIVPEVYS
ncbi:hypothetical protein A9Q84_05710 [Halobacteriovorax marinus]|uniref:ABC transporter domain-containing protein n=1 Tax=Halobacteriovorax marinus TaxID=97084 RepID=A0A1Y5FBH5_9BACT|nr:hypothetical protein A9Q84_05710 [Halobacteriovorax marinus]